MRLYEKEINYCEMRKNEIIYKTFFENDPLSGKLLFWTSKL